MPNPPPLGLAPVHGRRCSSCNIRWMSTEDTIKGKYCLTCTKKCQRNVSLEIWCYPCRIWTSVPNKAQVGFIVSLYVLSVFLFSFARASSILMIFFFFTPSARDDHKTRRKGGRDGEETGNGPDDG